MDFLAYLPYYNYFSMSREIFAFFVNFSYRKSHETDTMLSSVTLSVLISTCLLHL